MWVVVTNSINKSSCLDMKRKLTYDVMLINDNGVTLKNVIMMCCQCSFFMTTRTRGSMIPVHILIRALKK